MTTKTPLKDANTTEVNPLRCRAAVAPLATPTEVTTTSMPLKEDSVAGDNPHFGGG
jgi:hypothetical protein